MTTAEQIEVVRQYTQSQLANDQTGHGMDHIMRVVKMAKQIAQGEQIDPFLPVVAAYLHDTIDEKLVADVQLAQRHVADFLKKNDFTDEQVKVIMDTISNISFAHTLDGKVNLSKVAQIVRDADWLDAIGAIGIMRAIYYGGAHGEKIYDPAIEPRTNMTREEYRDLSHETIINHFSEKLFHIKDKLFTNTAQRIAEHRQQVMIDYVAEFKAEWHGEQ
ncbi:metal dependent phosphohydrolase [Limosilactobacillus frumenti DSM 13145]|uniref:Metal dependent phosphohydrolase n=1 Tax=Limosilactobacillus frumenti DSM 13145 TaxID=1423746 RepID=A0A0R1P3J5_9LACO|nr:HD domain-containing protein [Limosilactobacillus frumenti]KRL27150.1 metal dependent phosphohydrolase [Limosilactobacillus frumenti DSM 13145]MBA2913839.1 HD domain-containing protein [Limosilactobacillus frumenti]QFG72617.1 HD domain-containing protein [Limosilactobacillus frumenti]